MLLFTVAMLVGYYGYELHICALIVIIVCCTFLLVVTMVCCWSMLSLYLSCLLLFPVFAVLVIGHYCLKVLVLVCSGLCSCF